MTKNLCLTVIATGTFALMIACGQDTTNPNFDGTARVSIDNLTVWSVVSGTFEVQATPMLEHNTAKLELLRRSDGAVVATATAEPFALSWDTTQSADGLESVWVRATDKADNRVESPVLMIVVLNNGQVATKPDTGNIGEIVIPANYSGVTEAIDVREHWTNPAGIHSIMAVLNFAPEAGQSEWNIGLSIGKGFCPDDGQQYGDVASGTQPPIVVTVPVSAVTPAVGEFASGQFFAHLRPNNPNNHLGETLTYRLDVFLMK